MRNLLYYNLNSEFISAQSAAGGDGTKVVSSVDGIAWSNDIEKVYFNPHDETILTHTITVNYKSSEDIILAPSKTVSVDYISGKTSEIVLVPKNIENYEVRERFVTASVPNTDVVNFIYDFVPDYSQPLTFKIISGGTISWCTHGDCVRTIEYKLNNGDWTNITSSPSATASTLNVNSGDRVLFRGNNATYSNGQFYSHSSKDFECSTFSGSTAKFDICGNIMSLVNGTGFSSINTLTSSLTFCGLFQSCSGLISARDLLLPATTLVYGCYYDMFARCTSLTTAPELPATIMAEGCYYRMFYNCISLMMVPELPAVTLAPFCYYWMFYHCSSLVTIPSDYLPATSLTYYCYGQMFSNCYSLVSAPELPATKLNEGCYGGMFEYCRSLTTAPELPATGLTKSCYMWLFRGCSSLSYIKCLAVVHGYDTSVDWVNGVSANGTFVKNIHTTWQTGVNDIPSGWVVEDALPYKERFLTFNILSSGTINWKTSWSIFIKTIEYRINGGSWASLTPTTAGTLFNVNAGDKVEFKGDNATYWSGSTSSYYYNTFSGTTAKFELEGNIMSLVDSTNFATATTLSSSYTFYSLFAYCTGLTSNNRLVLPATSLTEGCYKYMFVGCTSLRTAPELPATTLADRCYDGMFMDCTSLVTVPSLSSSDLVLSCYHSMFNGCTSLTTAPRLPATKLAQYCYSEMFRGCTSLINVHGLSALTAKYGCYQSMFANCTSLTKVPVLSATTLTGNCYEGMFAGCTSLTTVPTHYLPVTTLDSYCYSKMFSGCTSLTTAPALPALNLGLAERCYDYMFAGCTSLTTAPELPATRLKDYCYEGMFDGCSKLNYVKCLATNTSAHFCTSNWVRGVSSDGKFVKNPNMSESSWGRSSDGIPANWTIEDAS